MSRSQVIRLKPYQYIHILNNNTNVTDVVVGPDTLTIQDHQSVVLQPTQMIVIPPRHYCIISNPVIREKGEIVRERGQAKLRHGDEEIRLGGDYNKGEPFPLYPGEKLYGKVTPLQVVAPLTAIKLRAIRDFEDKLAGDEWLFKGPNTYNPRVEVQVVEIVRAQIINSNQALRLKARKEFTSHDGIKRSTGEEWLVRTPGAYLPEVDEEIVKTETAIVLTDRKALRLRATRTFTDFYNVERKAGEEWLVTNDKAEKHIPDVFEQVVGEVNITTLNGRQYSVVLDPVNPQTGKPQFGKRELRRGPISFFLLPGESLEAGIQNVYILEEQEALLLRAREKFMDGEKERAPGDRWMINGPSDYIPPVSVEVVEKRRAIPLAENEGVYVRDMKTGRVKMVTGAVYMLSPYEELWSKDLPDVVEDLLTKDADQSSGNRLTAASGKRDKTRVVTYSVPHSAAVQIYDYKETKSRVIFGPDLILLGPDEVFTVMSLSGNTPKAPNALKVIALLLGPRFSTDVVVVETADHARLSLKLSYNWYFNVERSNSEANAGAAAKVFSVPDFIGDFCKAIASRVRGAVASKTFEDFHKNSASIIRASVFGVDKDGEIRNSLVFNSNNLIISNIDIQSVEPVDSKTRDALQKSVQLAIEITTKSQEATARHTAERREQEARGELERQKIEDESASETLRTELLQLQSKSMTVEQTGQASAEAGARSAAAKIEGQAAVEAAERASEASKIRSDAKLGITKKSQEGEITYRRQTNELEVTRATNLADIEADKFKSIVESIGARTIMNIAASGPALQTKLLQSLGVSNIMITDGSSPVNLFNTAGGIIGANQ